MMRQLDQETKNVSVNKVVNSLILPLLTGFLFDIPLLNKLLVSLALFLATYIAQDFVEALIKLWQATAVTALIFLFVNEVFKVSESIVDRSLYFDHLFLF